MTRHHFRRAPLVALACALSVGTSASALFGAEPVAGQAPASTQGAPLSVEIELEGSSLDTDAIVTALEGELGVPVRSRPRSSSEEGLRLRITDRRLVASYVRGDGASIERQVDLPREPARQLDTVALISGNLVRDEAGDLLASLQIVAQPSQTESAPLDAAAEPDGAEAAGEPTSPARPSSEQSAAEPAAPATPAAPAEKASAPPAELERAPFDFTVFSPISTHPDLWRREVGFSLGLFFTDFGRLDGVVLNGLVASGRAGGRGARIAGLWNGTGGASEGLDLAGLVSIARGGHEGAQLAGVFAQQAGDLEGAELALVSSVGGELHGAQLGLVNHVGGSVVGTQIGLVNVSGGEVHGAQIGLVNIGRGLRGVTLGLVNINPDLRVQAVTWASVHLEQGGSGAFSAPFMGHVGVKYLAKRFYSLIGLGLGSVETCPGSLGTCDGGAVLAPGVGFGARLDLMEPLFVELDGYYQWEVAADTGVQGTSAILGRAALGAKLLPKVEVFVGAGPRVDLAPEDESPTFSPHFFAGAQFF